jgi:hypothetical protein
MKTSLKLCILFLFLTACQSRGQALSLPTATVFQPTNTPPPPTQTPPPPTQTPLPQASLRQNEIASIWETSPHAQTTPPVQCDSCHRVENGVVLEEIAWRNHLTGQYEVVTGNDALCSQCHEVRAESNVHMTMTCTDCHDPHRVESSCTKSGCHSNIPTNFFELPATPTGGHPTNRSAICGGASCHVVATAVASTTGSIHGAEHAQVNCVACHDDGQMQVAPSPDDGRWATWQEAEIAGQVVNESHASHNIQREVDCARCHFENNPWELKPVKGDELQR